MKTNNIRIQVRKIEGQGRGTTIGIPTINFEIPSDLLLPYGVYAGWLISQNKKYASAIHYGPKPTFAETAPSLEAYILTGLIKDLSDSLSLEMVQQIRNSNSFHFSSQKELLAQIQKDIGDIKKVLAFS